MCDTESIPCIKVVGVGGAGDNTLYRIYNTGGIDGAESIAIDFDKQHLDIIKADKKVLLKLPPLRGHISNSCPKLGEKAADMGKGAIAEALRGADMVLMIVAMGGSMGTGAAPIVARTAREQGAVVICFASTPLKVERYRSVESEEGLTKLKKEADAVIVLDNNKLIDYVPNLPLEQVFSVTNQIMAEMTRGIAEALVRPSIINYGFYDVKSILAGGNTVSLMFGMAKSDEPVENIVRAVTGHPLSGGGCRHTAGAIVHMVCGPEVDFEQANDIGLAMSEALDPKADVIWGARARKEYEGQVQVYAILVQKGT